MEITLLFLCLFVCMFVFFHFLNTKEVISYINESYVKWHKRVNGKKEKRWKWKAPLPNWRCSHLLSHSSDNSSLCRFNMSSFSLIWIVEKLNFFFHVCYFKQICNYILVTRHTKKASITIMLCIMCMYYVMYIMLVRSLSTVPNNVHD